MKKSNLQSAAQLRETFREAREYHAHRPAAPVSTNEPLQWEASLGMFIGEVEALRSELARRYEDLGPEWCENEWKKLVRWCRDRPYDMAERPNHIECVLAWFRYFAKRERTKRPAATTVDGGFYPAENVTRKPKHPEPQQGDLEFS